MNKMKYIKSGMGLFILSSAVVLSGCKESFLEPDPLSFYEPTATFTTESGLSAALSQCDLNMKTCWASGADKMAIFNQFQFTDMLWIGTGNAASFNDMNANLQSSTVGTSELNDQAEHAIYWFWNQGYAAVKYSNTVLQYAPQVQGLSEDLLHEYMGRAYFHRSFWYYALVHEFRNVPLLTKLPESPKQNYKSTTREAILEMIEGDMENAVEWVPNQAPGSYTEKYKGGYVNNAACRLLLAKIYMANNKFDKALEQLNAIESQGYALMTEPFGDEVQPLAEQTLHVTRNVIWDLHRHENVFKSENKELIYGLVNSGTNVRDYRSLRAWMPFFFDGKVKAPSGKQAMANNSFNSSSYDPENDWLHAVGRGIGSRRPSPWSQHALWNVEGEGDKGDLRHNSEVGNWFRMEDMTYNHPDTKQPDDNGIVWYGQKLRLYTPGHEGDPDYLLCEDTLRRWYQAPLYKLYAYDADRNQPGQNQYNGVSKGSIGDLYLYRFAEVVLLRAECYIYLKQNDKAREELNKIRKRAHCDVLYTGTVTIDDVFDERARELYVEEWRHDEMVRASYNLVHTGIADRDGNVYTMEGITQSKGIELTKASFWYNRVTKYGGYNDGTFYIVNGSKSNFYYTLGKHNIFWPIPEIAITANSKGVLYQNYGYEGYDDTIPVFTNWEDAVADEAQ